MAWVPILVHRLTGEGAWDLPALNMSLWHDSILSGRQVKAADAGKTLSAVLWRVQASLQEGAPPLPFPFKWRWQLITGGGLWLRSAKTTFTEIAPISLHSLLTSHDLLLWGPPSRLVLLCLVISLQVCHPSIRQHLSLQIWQSLGSPSLSLHSICLHAPTHPRGRYTREVSFGYWVRSLIYFYGSRHWTQEGRGKGTSSLFGFPWCYRSLFYFVSKKLLLHEVSSYINPVVYQYWF